MKYLLLASAVSFALAYWLYRVQQRARDDFITQVFSALIAGCGVAYLMIYLAAAFWNHRFW